jgi:CheY-like chemotaxis protein
MSGYVTAVVDDMFFASKIRATAEEMKLTVRFFRNADALLEAARAELPSLVIADLHTQKCDPFSLAAQLKADEQLRVIPVLGFFSHVQTDLQQKAVQAGFDRVLPRSAFSARLPEILEGKF